MKTSNQLLLALLLFGLFACKTQQSESQDNSKTSVSIENLKSVNVLGETMHYIEKGKGEPIILIHGAISDFNVWGLQMDTLALNNRVIAISRRYAWPNSQLSRDESFDCTVALHARDLEAFMKELQIPSAHLIGHSYGAMIALRTAIDRPELVKSLILGEPVVESVISGTLPGDSLIEGFRSSANAQFQLYREGKDEEVVRQFLINVLGSDAAYDIVPQSVRDGWLQNLVEGICIAQTQDFVSISREDLRKMEKPTLLIKGEYSPALMKLVSDSLNVVIPNSELSVLPNASHGLQGENPAVFNRLVVKFLNDN